MKKRLMLFALTICMMLTVLPIVPLEVEAASKVSYYSVAQLPKMNMMNIEMIESSSFISKYELSNTSGRDFNAADSLGLHNTSTEIKKYYFSKTYTESTYNDPTFWTLYKSNQLKVHFGAHMRGDKHGSFKNHGVKKKTSNQWMMFNSMYLSGSGEDGKKAYRYGDFISFKNKSNVFTIMVGTGGCTKCGSCKFSNGMVVFADTVEPKITGWYMTATDSNSNTAPSSSDADAYTTSNTMYIHFKTSEPIRFSDNSWEHGDVKLGIILTDADTGQSLGGMTFYASLYALRNDVITFKLDIPSTIDSKTPNHYISGFRGITVEKNGSSINALDTEDAFSLHLMKTSTTSEYAPTILARRSGGMSKKTLEEMGLGAVDSVFTDLAGNSMGTVSLDNVSNIGKSKPLVDQKSPYIESVDIDAYSSSGVCLTGSVNNGDTVMSYIRDGNRVDVSITTSEPLSNSSIKIRTNVIKADGSYVEVESKSLTKVTSRSVPLVRYKYLFSFNIEEGMKLEEGSKGIAVKTILDTSSVKDSYGNVLGTRPSVAVTEVGKLVPSPQKDIYIDTLAPEIIITAVPDDDGMYPVMPEGANMAYFEFTIKDNTENGENQASGVEPIGTKTPTGTFVLTYQNTRGSGNKDFEYALLSSEVSLDPQSDFQWSILGKTDRFIQIEGTQRLYFRMPDYFDTACLPLKLTLEVSDAVGHTTSVEIPFDNVVFGNICDHAGPEISITGTQTSFDTSTLEGSITASFEASDSSLVDISTLQYAFVLNGTEPSDGDWKQGAEGTSQASVSADITLDGLGAEATVYDLYIRASDSSNAQNQTILGPVKISYDRSYPSYTVIANEKTYSRYPVLRLKTDSAPASGTPEAGVYALIRPRYPENYYGTELFASENQYVLLYQELNQYTEQSLLDTTAFVMYGSYDDATGIFTQEDVDYSAFSDDIKNGFYGIVDVRSFVAYGIARDDTTGLISAGEYPIKEDSYEMWLIHAWHTGEEDFFEFTIQWEDLDAVEAVDNWTPGNEGFGSLKTLAGQVFTVDIEPILEPLFGLDILDKTNSYVALVSEYNQKEIYKVPLTSSHTRVVIPDELEYNDLKDKVFLRVRAFTDIDAENSDIISVDYSSPQIYVNPDEIHDFGIAYLNSELKNQSPGTPSELYSISTKYGYELGDSSDEELYNRPDTIYVGAYIDEYSGYYEHHLILTAANYYTEEEFIQVNNITDGVVHTGSWNHPVYSSSETQKTNYTLVIYDTLEELNAAAHGASELPLLADTDNLIEYRMVHDNGEKSTVYTVIIHPVKQFEDPVISIAPGYEGEDVKDVYGLVEYIPADTTLYSLKKDESTYLYYWEEITEETFDLYFIDQVNPYTTISIDTVYAIDKYNNIKCFELEDPSYHWEHNIKVTNSGYHTNARDYGNVQRLGVNVAYDYYGDKMIYDDGYTLRLTFNEEYAERIKVDEVVFEIPKKSEWNGNGQYGGHRIVCDSATRNSGIFMLDIDETGVYNMFLVHKYDETLAEGETEEVSVTITVEDYVGNVSDGYVVLLSMVNTEPKISSVGSEMIRVDDVAGYRLLRVPTITSTVPMLEVYPNAFEAVFDDPTAFVGDGAIQLKSRAFVNIYRDGVYDITFIDVFGEYYTQKWIQPKFEWTGYSTGTVYDIGMDIMFSDEVDGKVTMTYASLDDRIKVDIIQATEELPLSGLTPGVSSDAHTVLAANVTEATVELDASKTVFIMMYDPEVAPTRAYIGTFGGGSPCVAIPNFVNTPPQATIEWYYEEWCTTEIPELYDEDDNPYYPTTTTKNVTASITTDRYINGIDGSGTEYTFFYGGEESYTFKFEDLSGQQGEITAVLPIEIVLPEPEPEDTEAPGYSIEIYGKYNAIFESVSEYDPLSTSALGDVLDSISWVQGYLADFRIEDSSPVKLIVKERGADLSGLTYENAQSDTIDSVTPRGTQVQIDAAVDFDVVLIDANSNITVLTFEASNFRFDLEPPTAIYDTVQTGLYEFTAYVKVADNTSAEGDIRWIYPKDAVKVEDGSYSGSYAIVFTENSTVTVRYADALGNQGTTPVTVDSIDTTPPEISDIRWAPYGTDSSVAPQRMVNTSVVATISFTKPIEEIKLEYKDGTPVYEISAMLQNNRAVLNFMYPRYDDNYESIPYEVILTYTGVNGVSSTEEITLGAVIDTDSPYAYVDYNEGASPAKVPYVDILIEGLSEDAYMLDTGNKLYKKGEDIVRRVYTNGMHVFKFIDLAGNIGFVTAEVTCIDTEPPVILLANLPDPDKTTNGDVTFRVTLNEWGKVTVNGTTKIVWAPEDDNKNGVFDEDECDWVEFTVYSNGGYKITAVDEAGRTTETYLTISTIDRQAPMVSFSPTSISVKEGTDINEIYAMLESGIQVWDNMSGESEISVAYDKPKQSLADTVGIHEIKYTVTDEAGNKREAVRYLRVFSASEPVVKLNGTKTYSGELTVLKDSDIAITVENLALGGNEPYTVYVRAGKWTEGQLKTTGEKLDSLNYTAQKNVYYTVLIVTQSRNSYLTYFMVSGG